MPNYQYASEWLNFARKHLETAELLYRENHYPDIIAIELHQTIEKSFKAYRTLILLWKSMIIMKLNAILVLNTHCLR
jgi:HEPN domain-containing protein